MRTLLPAFLLLIWGTPMAMAADTLLRVVPDLDLVRYAGVWYEVGRLPNRFQRDCAGDVSATYAVRDDGRVTVVNRCREADGGVKEAAGIARRVDGAPPSILKVRFAPAFLSFLPAVWGDYQVIGLAPDYSWAVIGSPDRKYLWVLARTPGLDDLTYRRLLQDAAGQGFDVSRVVRTEHRG